MTRKSCFTSVMYIAVSVAHIGCASSTGPESLTIDSSEYITAFHTAIETARAQGMPPRFRDVRSGIIETEPRIAGSILEPWRSDHASAPQAVENTIDFHRRRTRFEFLPVSHNAQAESSNTTTQTDLTQHSGQFQLRVFVFVERGTRTGLRRSTWSRRLTSHAILAAPEGETTSSTGLSWTAVNRDQAFERRLLADIESQLSVQTEESN